ncbi:hypothetical protein CIW48_19495 [Methylobacterium sp. P1-11]|uniref:hypothetical protein n=1 Tax=Methylobacterium sp. P1-11 TaxID=2024616 RepID=UPI0011EFBA56|nr:hypothetical protein [Methylobacterium sp. P1-11]KAA0122184.1 hypothetical protein CIW48_19495 [Methylobacterium sp. P1-11]
MTADPARLPSPAFNDVSAEVLSGSMKVASRGVTQSLVDFVGPDYYDFDWGWPGLGKPKRNGIDDDSAIWNAIAANKPAMKVIPGVINVKSAGLVHELPNLKLSVPGGGQSVQVVRDLALQGVPTMRIGSVEANKPAGNVHMDPLFIVHPYRLGFAGSALPSRLTNDESALEVHGAQGGDIGLVWFGHVNGISMYGGDGYTLRPYFAGGMWDNTNADLQETKSALRFLASPTHGHGKTGAILGGNLIGGYESAARDFQIGLQTLHRPEAIGAQALVLIESLEYGYIDSTFVGGANEHSIAVIPTSASCVLQSLKITNSDIDQSRISGVYARRDSASYPILQTLLISHTELNGVYEGRHAVFIDDIGGVRSVRNLGMSNLVTRAHLATPFYLRGVDGGFASQIRACGYNEAGNVNDSGPGLQSCVSGMYITGLTRNFRRSFCTFGGDANDDDATNKCQWGAIDGTLASANNRYFADMALNLGMAGGALRAGGTAETA